MDNTKKERKSKLINTKLCQYYERNEKCPYDNCIFAHGSEELRQDVDTTLSAQRKLIRDQVEERNNLRLLTENTSKNIEKKTYNKCMTQSDSMINRYYTRMYYNKDEKEDLFIYMHSNRLCLLGIAPGHQIRQNKLKITEVDFNVGKESANLLDIKVKGKKKKGGKWLDHNTALCRIKCSNNSIFLIKSCIRGSLIELNEELLKHPELLECSPDTDGYIAIIRPKTHEITEIQTSLVNYDTYTSLNSV